MVHKENDSAALRLDGIYLHADSLGIVDMLYFYENGTVLSRGSIQSDRLESKLAQLEVSKDEKYKRMKFLWGRYMIEGDNIKIEKWAPTDKPYRVYIKEGKIMNDSTFVIQGLYNHRGKKGRVIDERYEFRVMEGKPDSVNRWVVEGDKSYK
jgi:hypothetical protein